jgi:hypothetical protein
MLNEGLPTVRRSSLRPLACLLAAAMIASSSPLRAEPPKPVNVESGLADESDAKNAAKLLSSRDGATAITGTAPVLGAPAAARPTAAPPTPTSPPLKKDDGAALRTAGFIAGGVGIVGFVLFAVAGIGAKNIHDRLDEACNAGRCNEPSQEADIEAGKRLQTAANIGLATGLVGVGLGATLIVVGGHSAHDASANGAARPNAMITLAGRF